MDKIERFLEKGKLLDPELYNELKEMEEGGLVDELIESENLVLKKSDLRRARIPEPEIETGNEETKDHLFISDFTDFYLQRFEFLKGEIENKLDETTTTINRADGASSVVGMVRKVEDGDVVLEDKTGKIVLKTDRKFLKDEVVGVEGEVISNDGKRMAPDRFFFPGIPLGKEVNTTDQELRGLLVSDVSGLDEGKVRELGVDYVFVAGEPETKVDLGTTVVHLSQDHTKEQNTIKATDPARVKVGPISLLIHSGDAVDNAMEKLDAEQEEAMRSLLEKRHLNPSKRFHHRDPLLLDEVPDIVHVSGDPTMLNYKGVTFLSTSKGRGFVVNFRTRDTEEVELR